MNSIVETDDAFLHDFFDATLPVRLNSMSETKLHDLDEDDYLGILCTSPSADLVLEDHAPKLEASVECKLEADSHSSQSPCSPVGSSYKESFEVYQESGALLTEVYPTTPESFNSSPDALTVTSKDCSVTESNGRCDEGSDLGFNEPQISIAQHPPKVFCKERQDLTACPLVIRINDGIKLDNLEVQVYCDKSRRLKQTLVVSTSAWNPYEGVLSMSFSDADIPVFKANNLPSVKVHPDRTINEKCVLFMLIANRSHSTGRYYIVIQGSGADLMRYSCNTNSFEIKSKKNKKYSDPSIDAEAISHKYEQDCQKLTKSFVDGTPIHFFDPNVLVPIFSRKSTRASVKNGAEEACVRQLEAIVRSLERIPSSEQRECLCNRIVAKIKALANTSDIAPSEKRRRISR
mmetsp:Transcript_7702/g.15276  ORF Transcript_7702/g.15276 Transcript_7702/m.15276 type:complete len:404 (-) Transcript_7702:4325-5536(-)|eukprot:CAMPEP_0171485016 /NCGR_PEP_ID=MMETSP0958-20121227/318_1 /TAXON_ID=87120 /ORGANISM="Aurantiochytrium limacinum, Strain ATCCMYA-1381" /LENGTH=403 /DNA_ID=CAMNT_0012017773 /DNA_START=877 /DNA_END=2088 /DNA_ORIENTATION=-